MAQLDEYDNLLISENPETAGRLRKADKLEKEIQDLGKCHWYFPAGWRLGCLVTILVVFIFFHSGVFDEPEAQIYSFSIVVLLILMVCENIYRHIRNTHKRIEKVVGLVRLMQYYDE